MLVKALHPADDQSSEVGDRVAKRQVGQTVATLERLGTDSGNAIPDDDSAQVGGMVACQQSHDPPHADRLCVSCRSPPPRSELTPWGRICSAIPI